MKISTSSVTLGAEVSAFSKTEKHESLTVWHANQGARTKHGMRAGRPGHQEAQPPNKGEAVKLSLSDSARGVKQVSDPEVLRAKPMDELKFDILKAMIEKLTGKKIEIVTADDIMSQPPSDADQAQESQGGREGSGFIYDAYESYYEYQSLDFSAQGSITTSDGKRIDFSVSLSMSYEFYTEQHVEIRAGDALKDPLSVNFSGSAAELSETEFSFDIDADGRSDQIAFLKPGSGFLALDRNSDGVINDGTELFGAVTGDGFAELSQYDEDKNNFIDSNDPIYDRLRIWSREADGTDRLLALGKAGVGAIFLGSSASPFDIKDSTNALLGKVRSTGFFLREDGSAGTIQQIDLRV